MHTSPIITDKSIALNANVYRALLAHKNIRKEAFKGFYIILNKAVPSVVKGGPGTVGNR
jgi:hypothetical protein